MTERHRLRVAFQRAKEAIDLRLAITRGPQGDPAVDG